MTVHTCNHKNWKAGIRGVSVNTERLCLINQLRNHIALENSTEEGKIFI